MFEEYIGKKYGKLTITAFDHFNPRNKAVFNCICDCGNKLQTAITRLESSQTKDCGCSKRKVNLIGKRFGRLMVIEETNRRSRSHIVWKCLCDCGNEVEISSHDLITRKSCGCIKKEKEHFACKLPIHKCWDTMLERCYNPNKYYYYLYGGRGIRVCDEWNSRNGNIKAFANFYNWAIANGYSDERLPNGKNKYTIDRIDSDGDYTPENCRWITNKEQQNNKRADKLFTYNGETKTIKQWLKQYFVKCQDYYALLRMGYDNKFILDFISSVDKEKMLVIYHTPKGTIVNDILKEYLSI